MTEINLLYFFNIFCSGILFSLSIMTLLTGHKSLKPHYLFAYYAIDFAVLLMFNLGIVLMIFDTMVSDIFLFFIPFLTFFYGYQLGREHTDWRVLGFAVFPAILVTINFFTPLFIPLYLLIANGAILVFFLLYYRKKERHTAIGRYRIGMILILTAGFFPYAVINPVVSVFNQTFYDIKSLIPGLNAVAGIAAFVVYIRSSRYFAQESVKKSSIFEKQSTIEKLATSLIHEIKNPLAAIQSLTQQMQSKGDNLSGESRARYLDIISQDLERIKSLADSFLKTYRFDETLPDKPVDLYITAQSVAELVRFELLKHETTLVTDKSLICMKVLMNNYRLRQILLNLIYNSMEAESRNILFRCEIEEPSSRVVLIIEDDGKGIAAADQKKLFQLFFTTKEQGTGVGLTVCQKIIESHGGTISLLQSAKGKTVFKITFPEVKDTL